MTTIAGSTVVRRPVEEVFDFVADGRNEPLYNPRMVRSVMLTPGPVRAGTRWSATMAAPGREIHLATRTTTYDRPRRLGSVSSMPGMDMDGAVTFRDDPEGTRVSWSWQLHPHGLLRLAAPVLTRIGRRQEQQTWDGLKKHLETRPTRS